MNDRENTENLIARYLNGKCTSGEIHELRRWVEKSSDNITEYLAIKDVWDSLNVSESSVENQLALFYKNRFDKTRSSYRQWIRYSTAIAAILLVGLVISVLTARNILTTGETTQVVSVPLGSRSKVLLADGTEVSLNSGSELKYSSAFSSHNREVSISGEGFFHVTSDKDHPFTVKTSDFDIQVTGTQFNVNTYNDNHFSNASLAEGKIQVVMTGSSQAFEIRPNEKFELDRTSRKYKIENTDIESEIAWKDGSFIFKHIPFPDLVQKLERWYDVKLKYNGSELQNYVFTGRFKNQETIWQVLDALKLTMPIDYCKENFREFTIIYKP